MYFFVIDSLLRISVCLSIIKSHISNMAQRMSKRLQKEYEAIQKNNQEMKVLLPNNDLSLWHVNFLGAKGTLYEG